MKIKTSFIRRIAGALLLASVMAFAGKLHAGVMIDDFSYAQAQLLAGDGIGFNDSSTVTDPAVPPSILGSERYMKIVYGQGGGTLNGEVTGGSAVLTFNNDGTAGGMTLTWDGPGTSPDNDGLGQVDLTAGGADAFQLNFNRYLGFLSYDIRIGAPEVGGDPGVIQGWGNIIGVPYGGSSSSTPVSFQIPFSDYDLGGGAPAPDLTKVEWISLSFETDQMGDTTTADFMSLDSLQTVPEVSEYAIVGAGLCLGFALLRRFRRRAEAT